MRRISPPKRKGKAPHSTGQLPGDSIQVELRDALPARVQWGKRRFEVQSVDNIWCVEGRWWLDADLRGIRRRYYRLSLCSLGGLPHCFEIYRQDDKWKLWRIAD